jgi:hypothetical protein
MSRPGEDERPDSDELPAARLSPIGRLCRRLVRIGGSPGIVAVESPTPPDSGSAAVAGPGDAGRPKLFERLSCAGRDTLDAAQEEARILGHRTVGTEHLLLALTRNAESGACKVMERMGATPATVRADVLSAIVSGATQASGRLAFTPRARLAVELAHRASERIGVPQTGTEHLLIGLAAEGEGIAAQALCKSGIVARTAETQVTVDLDGTGPFQ